MCLGADFAAAFTMADHIPNPVDPEKSLKRPADGEQKEEAHPPQPIFPEDSAITKAEKVERNGIKVEDDSSTLAKTSTKRTNEADADTPMEDAPSAKRVKVETQENDDDMKVDTREKIKGIALVKPE